MKINKNLILLCFIYILFITVLEFLLVVDYSYFSLKLVTFCLSFYVIGILSICECYKSKSFFSLNTIFNLFSILYTNYFIVQSILQNIEISDTIYFSMNLSYISILAFNFGYLISKRTKILSRIDKNNDFTYNISRVVFLSTILLLLGLVAEFYVIFYRIGFRHYTSVSRASQALLLSNYSILTFYRSTIPLVSILFLYIRLKFKNKICLLLFIISFSISILNSIFSVSRAELLSIILPTIFLLNHFKKISNKQVIILGISTFILFGLWKGLSYGKTNVMSYDSEFNSWYSICNNVLLGRRNFEFLYGKSYAKTLLNLVIPVTNTTSLSTWYVKTYEYAVYLRGGGRGFSGVLEAYMNFGILGNVLVYYFYGLIIKQLDKKSDLQIIIYMIFMISIFQMFRSESYSLWKNMMWFKIIPVFLIFFVSRNIKISDTSNVKC